ncbi:MAG TPA: GMC family oxidoreductase [Gemmatimonadales bacterium]|nr:GMC family oxidoreductase [Gemmatimonadales bacterium]
MDTIRTDVVVIGSGFGAAAPALRLAQAGLRVLMIEKGPPVEIADFRQTQDPKYLLRYLKGLSGDHLSLTYAEALGGGSGFYEMVSLRAPSQAFAQRDARGRPLWPAGLDRRALDPYYDLAERMLRVEQIEPHQVPKSGLVFSLLMKNLGYSCDRARYAVRNCLGSGFCVTGCIYGAKQSLHVNYLPQARAAGAQIECNLEAILIRPTPAGSGRPSGPLTALPHRYEVVCRRRDGSRSMVSVLAKLVILGGGTVGTARLLLASRRALGGLSRQVGRHIAFNGSVKVAGILPEGFPDGDMFAGRSHPGMISYEFLESRGITISAAKPLPLQVVTAARLRLDGDERQPAHWGTANVELMRQYRHRMIILVSFGLTPPGGVIAADDGQVRLSLRLDRALRRYYSETKEILRDILRRNGCRLVETEFVDRNGAPRDDLHFSTAHQVGSCRMADHPARGVVAPDGEVFGHPGLYVTDGAAIPSSLAVNTSLTILANAERIAAGILERYRLRATAAAA